MQLFPGTAFVHEGRLHARIVMSGVDYGSMAHRQSVQMYLRGKGAPSEPVEAGVDETPNGPEADCVGWGPRSIARECSWAVSTLAPGTYYIEAVQHGQSLGKVGPIELVELPAAGGKPVLGVDPTHDVLAAFVTSDTFVMWLPGDARRFSIPATVTFFQGDARVSSAVSYVGPGALDGIHPVVGLDAVVAHASGPWTTAVVVIDRNRLGGGFRVVGGGTAGHLDSDIKKPAPLNYIPLEKAEVTPAMRTATLQDAATNVRALAEQKRDHVFLGGMDVFKMYPEPLVCALASDPKAFHLLGDVKQVQEVLQDSTVAFGEAEDTLNNRYTTGAQRANAHRTERAIAATTPSGEGVLAGLKAKLSRVASHYKPGCMAKVYPPFGAYSALLGPPR